MASTATAPFRALDTIPAEGSDIAVPVSRPRPRSASLTQAAIEHVDAMAREKLGGGLRPEVKMLITKELEGRFDQLLEELRGGASTVAAVPGAPQPSSSSKVGWVLAAVLGTALFIGALGVTWAEIWTVRRAQQADDEYAMIVANWLVTEAAQSYERAQNIDVMMRRISTRVGADVSDIAKPTRSHPPTAIQRRNNDYLLSRGE